MATMFPGEDANLASLLGDHKGKPDILMLALQEVKSQPQNLLAGDCVGKHTNSIERAYHTDLEWKLVLDTLVAGEDPWTSSLRGSLAPLGYVEVQLITPQLLFS